MPICEFKGCGRKFKRAGNSQKFCKHAECVEARKKKRKNMTVYLTKGLEKKQKKNCIKGGCRNKTSNRFGICNTCRDSILSSIDSRYLDAID